jgi:uncharacterized Zn-binding protein involved in type VI secretion
MACESRLGFIFGSNTSCSCCCGKRSKDDPLLELLLGRCRRCWAIEGDPGLFGSSGRDRECRLIATGEDKEATAGASAAKRGDNCWCGRCPESALDSLGDDGPPCAPSGNMFASAGNHISTALGPVSVPGVPLHAPPLPFGGAVMLGAGKLLTQLPRETPLLACFLSSSCAAAFPCGLFRVINLSRSGLLGWNRGWW